MWNGAILSEPNILPEFIFQFVDGGTETTSGLDENAIGDIASGKCYGFFFEAFSQIKRR